MANKKIGALWKRTTKSGKTFLSGIIEETRFDGTELKLKISIWTNDAKKDGSKQPDCVVYLDDYKGREAEAKPAPAPADESPFPGEGDIPSEDDEIPF